MKDQDIDALKMQISDLSDQIEKSLIRERLFREDFAHQLIRDVEARLLHLTRQSLALALPDNAPIFTHTLDGHRILLDQSEPFITYHVLEHGEWEKPMRTLLRALLAPGDTYVDVGANIGLHVLLASMLVGESGKIIALEPHPHTANLLRKNLEINGLIERVDCVQAAACSEHGTIRSFEYFPQHSAMSAFSIDKNRIDLFSGTIEKVDVETVTLDKLLLEKNIIPDVIKIDVEGFEMEVLSGSINSVKNIDTVFILEFGYNTIDSINGKGSSEDMFSLMKDNRFKCYGLVEDGLKLVENFENAKIFDDLLFVKNNSKKNKIVLSLVDI